MTAPLKVHGVDISHHQNGRLDFVAARRAGVRFVYHKATEGNGFKDRNYAQRRKEVAKAGIAFGAYHFARPTPGDARSEARHFVSVAAPKPGDLLPCLDIETTEGLSAKQLDVWAKEFVAEVKKLTGFNCVVYTPFDLPSVGHCPLWVARYSNSNALPNIPEPWKNATIRQFSNGEYGVPNNVHGLGHVDLNTFGPGAGLGDILIPVKVNAPKPTRGYNVEAADRHLERATGTGRRRQLINKAKALLDKIKPV